MEPLVKIDHLSKQYGKFAALSDINIELPKGKIIGLLGPNGSGKTTIIKVLTGLLKEYTGEVLIDGEAPSPHTKSMVSYLPERTYLSDWMQVKDAVNMFQDFYQDFDKEKALELLRRMGIDPKQKIKTLSKGMYEKVQLVLVMSRKAKLYILDEPISGVDPAARDLILDTILDNYDKDSTILLSTHLIADVERMFDNVIFLKEGKVILEGDVDTIRQEHGESIDQLFREVFRC